MANSFTVQIDLERVQQNFSRGDGRAWSEEEVRQWLCEVGFESAEANLWLCPEDSLYALTPEEIIEQRSSSWRSMT